MTSPSKRRMYEWGQLTLDEVLPEERGFIFVETPREGRERPLLFSTIPEAVWFASQRGLVLGLDMSRRPQPLSVGLARNDEPEGSATMVRYRYAVGKAAA